MNNTDVTPHQLNTNILKAMYVLWWRDMKRYLQDKYRIIASLAMPLMYLVVLGTGLSPVFKSANTSYISFLFPGIIAMTVLFTGVFFGFSIIWDREFGFLKAVLVAPIPRWAIAIGKSISGATIATIQGLMILVLSPFIGVRLSIEQVVAMFVLIILIAFAMSSIGVMIAARMRSMEGFQMIMSFLLMPMFFLSGAMFPIDNAPLWLQAASSFDPLTYGVSALRHVSIGVGGGISLSISLISIIIFSVFMISVAVYAFNRTD